MKKGIQTSLFSIVGVAVMAVILVAVNWLGSRAKARIDLTAERAYTLSPGTRAILAKLDTPVQVRFYATRGENKMPVFLKQHAQVVQDLLDEFRQVAKGKIEIQKLDPKPDSDAEDSARLDGVEGRILELGEEPVYLGFSVTMLDAKETEPFLDPREERQLEYKIARAISRVMTTDKPVLGIMSPFSMTGGMNPMSMRTGRPSPPWLFHTEIKRSFNVKTVEMTVDKIPDDVKVLLLVHPKGISEPAQWAIDQFLLRGGKLVALLDPLAVLDPQAGGQFGATSSSSIDKLLTAWGLKFDSTKVVADMNYTAQTGQGPNPAVLALTENAVNKDDVLTSGATSMLFAFAGAFSGTPAEGLKQTVLMKSSKDSQFVDPMMAQMGGGQIKKDFAASGTEQTLALRLAGRFKTAFPEGKPKAAEPPQPDGKKDEKKPDAPAEQGLKEATMDGVVILVGDSDFIQDQLLGREMMAIGGQRFISLQGSNLAFAQGAVDQLAGDSNLIGVRSRAARERPFTVVSKMQADAEARYQSKIKELEAGLASAQQKVNELQRAKAGEKNQRFILSPEQQAEIANFRKKEADVKKELKQVRKSLNADIDSLENRVKWLNIAAMPALVVALGIIFSVMRRRKTAAT
ncbi:MAG: GldG family protein [Chthoniobacteraceae bacterium]